MRTHPEGVQADRIRVFLLLPWSVALQIRLRNSLLTFSKGSRLLTEQQISRSWRKLFSTSPLDEQTFEKAAALLDELRPESPLRHRLGNELHELRKRKLQEQN